MYLTAGALKARLRGRSGLKLGGDRAELLLRCHENGLITDYERLATRCAEETRKAWLEHELTLAGCTLRCDSRLCEAYIRNNRGHPREIAGVMAEMKFYYNHTRYESIKDELHQTAEDEYHEELDEYERDREIGCADRDFRPCFRDFYCSEDASDSAKIDALDAWVQAMAGNSLEIACEHPTLPPTLRRSLLNRVADARFKAWAGGTWKVDVLTQAARIVRPILHAESMRLMDLTPGNFEAWFGDRIRACADVVRERVNVDRFIEQAITAKGIRPTRLTAQPTKHADCSRCIRLIASDALKEGLTSARAVRAIKDAAAEYIALIPCVVNPGVTFTETINRLFGRIRNPTTTDRERIKGRWRCGMCNKYTGSGQGVWDHSLKMHGVQHIRYVKANLEPDNSIFVPLTVEAFRELIVRAMRRQSAARTIQTHWRNAIACPEFFVCRRRLQREVNECMF